METSQEVARVNTNSMDPGCSAPALTARWLITTERWQEARTAYIVLREADVLDIQALRRAARQLHDLEQERGALARELENPLQ
jgi:hypothetical protein